MQSSRLHPHSFNAGNSSTANTPNPRLVSPSSPGGGSFGAVSSSNLVAPPSESSSSRRNSALLADDFEALLRTDETRVIKQDGIMDMDELGAKTSPEKPFADAYDYSFESSSSSMTIPAFDKSTAPQRTPFNSRTRQNTPAPSSTTRVKENNPMNSQPLIPARGVPIFSANPPPPPPPDSDTKRRSIYRSVGTASSPDLASLLRAAKAKAAVAAMTTGNGAGVKGGAQNGNEGSSSERRGKGAEGLDDVQRTSSGRRRADTTIARDRDRERDYRYSQNPVPSNAQIHPSTTMITPPTDSPSIFSTPQSSPQSSAPATSIIPSTPPQQQQRDVSGGGGGRSRQNSANTLAIPMTPSGREVPGGPVSPSGSSFVNIPTPPRHSSPDRERAARLRRSGGGVSPMKTDVFGSAQPLGLDSEIENWSRKKAGSKFEDQGVSNANAFQNTMRKTSGFFKRTFGTAGKASMTTSAPNTPVSNVFSRGSSSPPPPPVPALPPSYISSASSVGDSPPVAPKRRSSVRGPRDPVSRPKSNSTSDSAPAVPPKDKVQESVNFPGPGDNAPNNGKSQALNETRSGPREALSPIDHTRRRSVSLNSATVSSYFSKMDRVESTRDGEPARAVGAKGSKMSEDERLKRELKDWELDLDGVLGGIGKIFEAPLTAPASFITTQSAPVTPLVPQDGSGSGSGGASTLGLGVTNLPPAKVRARSGSLRNGLLDPSARILAGGQVGVGRPHSAGVSGSQRDRRPSFDKPPSRNSQDAPARPSLNESQASASSTRSEPISSKRSFSGPTLDLGEGGSTSRRGEDEGIAVSSPEPDTPSIRLIPSPKQLPSPAFSEFDRTYSRPGLDPHDISMIQDLRSSLGSSSSSSSSSSANGHGGTSLIGLGLETIKEAHSREASLAASPAMVEDGQGFTTLPNTPQTITVPTLITHSPTPNPSPNPAVQNFPFGLQSPTSPTGTPLTPLRKSTARNSIVAYPSSASSQYRNPGGMGDRKRASSSNMSLNSEPSNMNLSASVSRSSDLGSELDLLEGNPVEQARAIARKFWDGDESFLKKEKMAEWLGSNASLNRTALRFFMELFDFKALRLDSAFRRLCEQLYLKGETQQVDRILEEFSNRYWETNRGIVYGSADVIHAVSYSLLLLNTDLHVADVQNRMSKAQFVRNTMAAIHSQQSRSSRDSTPDLVFGQSNVSLVEDTVATPADDVPRTSMDRWRENLSLTGSRTATRTRRSGSVHSWKSLPKDRGPLESAPNLHSPLKSGKNGSTASIGSVQHEAKPRRSGSLTNLATSLQGRQWDAEMEALLKEMYAGIRAQPVFQPMSSSSLAPPDGRSSLSLTPGSPYGTWGISRTSSRRGHTPVGGTERGAAHKRASIRGFLGYSQESFRPSSPSPSMATSLTDSAGGTGYLSSPNTSQYTTATIGFASNLSHTIIKEQQEDDVKSESEASADEEELALLGAPWAKEGILHRKHYWEAPGKRSKDKTWLQVFVVIQKGDLKMFKFGDSSGGMSGGGVGGGNWLANAAVVGDLPLAHALCSTMPPPGYSKDRQHVFVLTLANGGSYFFQAGTEDLVNEWVSTCNYWSARTSKEPLSGGVSNMEYGWNRVPKRDDDDTVEDMASIRSGKSGRSAKSGKSRTSYQGSVGRDGVSFSHQNPNDRLFINEWKPPQPPAVSSTLGEESQFENLKRHAHLLQTDLEKHNELRTPMMKLYSPRSVNLSKALANWERKSQHLLSEIVKYKTYIDNLAAAMALRQKKTDEKQVAKLLRAADEDDGEHSYLSTIMSEQGGSTQRGTSSRAISPASTFGQDPRVEIPDPVRKSPAGPPLPLDAEVIQDNSMASNHGVDADPYEDDGDDDNDHDDDDDDEYEEHRPPSPVPVPLKPLRLPAHLKIDSFDSRYTPPDYAGDSRRPSTSASLGSPLPSPVTSSRAHSPSANRSGTPNHSGKARSSSTVATGDSESFYDVQDPPNSAGFVGSQERSSMDSGRG